MNWNKFLGLAIVVSVAVNLLLAGFIIGRMIPERDRFSERVSALQRDVGREVERSMRERMQNNGEPEGQIGDLNIISGAMAVGEQSRRTVRDIAREHAGDMRDVIRGVREKRREILRLLAEEPENLEKIEGEFDALSNMAADAQRRAQQIVLDIARQLPEDERAAFLRGASRPARR